MWTDVDEGSKCMTYICTLCADETSTIDSYLICTIVVDGEPLKDLLTCNRTGAGRPYYQLDFTAVLSFGLISGTM